MSRLMISTLLQKIHRLWRDIQNADMSEAESDNHCKQLIEIYERKIKERIDRVWEE